MVFKRVTEVGERIAWECPTCGALHHDIDANKLDEEGEASCLRCKHKVLLNKTDGSKSYVVTKKIR